MLAGCGCSGLNLVLDVLSHMYGQWSPMLQDEMSQMHDGSLSNGSKGNLEIPVPKSSHVMPQPTSFDRGLDAFSTLTSMTCILGCIPRHSTNVADLKLHITLSEDRLVSLLACERLGSTTPASRSSSEQCHLHHRHLESYHFPQTLLAWPST